MRARRDQFARTPGRQRRRILRGGAGDDVLIGGLGLDTPDPGTGDNVSIQSLVAQNLVLQFQKDLLG